jgi:hypothetical protein
MTAKKKSKKKNAKVKTRAPRTGVPLSKAARKKLAKKKVISKGKLPKTKLSAKRATAKKKSPDKKKAVDKRAGGGSQRRAQAGSQNLEMEAFPPRGRTPRSAGQSGDLQGLSNVEGADSESVDELLEEGNAFEAEVVAGVERAGNADEKEVRTHEVPEDDIPGEYLDKD